MDAFRRRTLSSVVACILCGASGLASAGEPAGIVVKFGDLNLDTHDGVATLYARLEAAARTACTAREGTSSNARSDFCIDYSVRQAVARIGAPRLERECGLLALLDDLTLGTGASARPAGDPGVARALEYLRDCWRSPVDLDTLASAAGTTKFRLLRRFRAEVGITPHRFLVSVRVAHARRLLAAGTPISVVAAETGFADQSHLNRHFRDRLGFTPARYRRLVVATPSPGRGLLDV